MLLVVGLLVGAALVAGFVDAIAGGGGLLTVPALLVAIADPRLALGTNKGQAVFGSGASLIAYVRAGRVDKARFWPTFLSALCGSAIGARLLLAARPELLRPLVLVLLVGVAAFFAWRGRKKPAEVSADKPAPPRRPLAIAAKHPTLLAIAIALVIGAYDGFFGPGTGTFLIVLYTSVFGDDLTRATANAKVANFASNLAAMVSFALAGQIDFRIALPMAAAQALGGVLGARAAVRGGEKLIRITVLVVALALAMRIAYQIVASR